MRLCENCGGTVEDPEATNCPHCDSSRLHRRRTRSVLPAALAAVAMADLGSNSTFPYSGYCGPGFNTRTREEWRQLDRERAEKRARRKAKKFTEANKGNEDGKPSLSSLASVKK